MGVELEMIWKIKVTMKAVRGERRSTESDACCAPQTHVSQHNSE